MLLGEHSIIKVYQCALCVSSQVLLGHFMEVFSEGGKKINLPDSTMVVESAQCKGPSTKLDSWTVVDGWVVTEAQSQVCWGMACLPGFERWDAPLLFVWPFS